MKKLDEVEKSLLMALKRNSKVSERQNQRECAVKIFKSRRMYVDVLTANAPRITRQDIRTPMPALGNFGKKQILLKISCDRFLIAFFSI